MLILRVLGAGLIFWIVALFLPKQKVNRKDMIRIFIAALLGIALNQAFFFEGITLTSPVDASIIHVLNPLIVLLLSSIFLKERITVWKVVGIILGASGAMMIILNNGNLDFSSENILGNLLILANTSAYAGYLIVNKPLIQNYHPVVLMKWLYLFGFILILPYGGSSVSEIDWSAISLNSWLAVFYISAVVTFGAYYLTIYGLKYLSPIVVSIYIYLQPLFTTLIAIFYFSESVGILKILASMLIFAGVVLASRKSR
jgi:drug/metabolite transporter (DMT)-like permease